MHQPPGFLLHINKNEGGRGYVWGEINSFWEAEKSRRGEFWEDWEKKAAALSGARSLCAKVGQSEREAKGGQ